VARTASRALADSVRIHLRALFEFGLDEALEREPGLASGVYLYRGTPVHEALATAIGVPATPLADLLTGGTRP